MNAPICNVHIGNCLDLLTTFPRNKYYSCITSPPYYGQRDYGNDEQIGLEETPDEYVRKLVGVFREVRRVLHNDGTVWLNLGDTYASNWGMGAIGRTSSWWSSRSGTLEGMGWGVETAIKPNTFKRGRPDGIKVKDLMGIPWRVAFALQQDGWYLRQEIIWNKVDAKEMGVRSLNQRCAKTHEHIFLVSKHQNYYFDHRAIMETTNSGSKRHKRSVWDVKTSRFDGAHFATFPMDLIEPCILAGCPVGEYVLDPFAGSGTTGIVAALLGRNADLIELNPDYAGMAIGRLKTVPVTQGRFRPDTIYGCRTCANRIGTLVI